MPVIVAMIALLTGTSMHAVRLRCEYLDQPLAIQTPRPRFSWWVDDDRKGARQTAYRIQVQADGKATWDSGEIQKPQASQIEYAGQPLGSRAACRWRVQLKDERGELGEWSRWSGFRVGLLEKKDWQARWIQSEFDAPPILPAHNGYHAEGAKSATEIKWVEIDLGREQEMDGITLYPTQPFDWSPPTPGFLFPLRFLIEVDGKIVVNQKEDHPMATGPVKFSFPTAMGRRVRLTTLQLRERSEGIYGLTLAEMSVTRQGTVISAGAKVTAKDSLENKDWGVKNLTNGDLTSHPTRGTEALPPALMRKEFDSPKKVRSAVLYVTALGAYQVHLNGKRVGDQVLSPEWTDYHTRVQYQTYDVTKLLAAGSNRIDVTLGDGWYAGRLGMAQALSDQRLPRGIYGRLPAFLGQLEITYADGTQAVVATDKSWTATNETPILSSDIYDGEVYDATRPIGPLKPVRMINPTPEPLLVAQPNEPIRVTKRLKPLSITEPTPGKYVIDMGQNMVGWARLKLSGPKGTKVIVRYAEARNDDGTAYFTNLRGAPQIDTFTLNGKQDWFEPHFTYHGFRFIQIEGLAQAPQAGDIVGMVFHSSSPEATSFETSNPMVDRLWQNIVWTQRANLMSVPTDCPQRDERLGWTGDIEAFGQTAAYVMDLSAFYTKWMADMRDAQADDGRFPDFAPHPYGKNRHFTGVPGWGDAGVGVPYVQWLNYADKSLILEHFDSMERWLKWIASKNPNHLWEKSRHNDYGDWLNGDTLVRDGWPRTGAELPKDVFATLMWFQSASQVAEMAGVIGNSKASTEYAQMAREVQSAFVTAYVGADGKIKGDTQAGYAIALGIGILPENLRAPAFTHLVAALDKYNGSLSTGFHSTHHLMNVLTRYGRADLAYKLLTNTTFPSWGYSIENGSTTIWERWDGYVKGRGFQDPGMNSLNHWALGAVGEWMIQSVLGIQPKAPGWTRFGLAPVPGGELRHAKGHFDSPVGRIEVDWKYTKTGWQADAVIPANASAEVRLPGKGTVDGKDRGQTFELESGRYRLEVPGLRAR